MRSKALFTTLTTLTALTAVSGLLAPAAARACDRDQKDCAHDGASFHVDIQGDHDKSVELTIGGWAADIVRAAMPVRVRCGGDHDERVVTVLRFLDRHGESSRYTLWDDGSEFTGSRAHGRFSLRVSGGRWNFGHGRAHIEGPWALADCMMGGMVSVRELIDSGENGLDLLVAGDDGRVHITLR